MALFNLARRNVRSSWRHQVIVIVLIAIPVGLGVFTTIADHSVSIDGRQYFVANHGASDFGLSVEPDDVEDVVAELTGAGAELLVYRRVVTNPGFTEVTDVDLTSPLSAGMVTDFEGRAPERLGEVALSVGAAEAIGVELGQTMPAAFGGPTTVVGIVRPMINYERRIYLPAASLSAADSLTFSNSPEGAEADFVHGRGLRTTIGVSGLSSREIEALIGPFGGPGGPWLESPGNAAGGYSVGGGIGAFISAALLVEVALLAAASFAIRSRRRVVEFGRLSAIGATPEQVSSLVLVEAVVMALIGAALGIIVAVGWAVSAPNHAGALFSFIVGDPETITSVVLNPLGWLWPPLFAVLAALAAAAVPARTASRLSVSQALASGGGQDIKPARRRFSLLAAVAGFSLIALAVGVDSGGSVDGSLVTILVFMGVIALVLAVAGTASAILTWLDRSPVARLPISLRLAVRDSARHRLRSVAALTAAGLIIGVAVVAMTLAADSARSVGYGEDASIARLQTQSPVWIDLAEPTAPTSDATEVAERLGLDVPVALTGVGHGMDELAAVEIYYNEGSSAAWAEILVVDGDNELAARLPAKVRTELERPGSLVALRIADADPAGAPGSLGGAFSQGVPSHGGSGQETVSVRVASGTDADFSLAVVEVAGESMAGQLVRLGLGHLISPGTAETNDLPTADVGNLIVAAEPFSAQQLATLGLGGISLPSSYDLAGSDPAPVSGRSQLVALAVVGAIVILVYRLLAGLIAVDTDEAVSTMLALGAPSRLRQTHLAGHALVHLTLAVVLSVPVALMVAEIVDNSQVFFNPFVVPWTLLVGLLALPVAGAGFVALSTRSGVAALSRRAT